MSKKSLLTDLSSQRDALLELCDRLSDAERAEALTPEGWSARDFIGHLSYWEQFTLDCIRDTFKLGRPTPLPPEALYEDTNGRAAARRKDWSWERVRKEFENTRHALIQRVDGLTESDLQFSVPSPWVNDARIIPLETLIREDVLQHGQEHLGELQKWHQQHASQEHAK